MPEEEKFKTRVRLESETVGDIDVTDKVEQMPVVEDRPIVDNLIEEKHYESKSQSKFIVVVIAFIIGIALGGLGVKVGSEFLHKEVSVIEVDPTPVVTQAPDPTATPIPLKRGDLKVQVLNGGGKKGAAAVAADKLKGLGYVVARTGNADEADIEVTSIKIREDKKQFTQTLLEDLSSSYEVSSSVSAVVSISDGVDAVVTIGSKVK